MANLRVLGNEIDIELEKKLEKGMWLECVEDNEEPAIMWIKKDGVAGQIFIWAEEGEYYGDSFSLFICTSRQIQVIKDGNTYQVKVDSRGEGNDPLPEEILKLADIYKHNPFIEISIPENPDRGPLFGFSLYEDDFTGKQSEYTQEMNELKEIAGINIFTKDDLYAVNTMLPYYEMAKKTVQVYKGGHEEFRSILPKAFFRIAMGRH